MTGLLAAPASGILYVAALPGSGHAPTRPPPPLPAAARSPASAPPREALERQSRVPPAGVRKKGRYRPPGSPQRFLAAIKLGPYVPEVDRAYDGPGVGPYASVFGRTDAEGRVTGDPKPGAVGFGLFEWQFAYVYGAFGLGLQLGYFRDKAKAPLAAPPPEGPYRSEADDTAFHVLPLAVSLGYRFSYLDDRFHVPIVPYAHGGIGYGFWWSTDGSGKVAKNEAGKASGGSWGWLVTAGGMLRLDFLDPGGTRQMDAETGVNHFGLFGEYQILRLDGFGRGRSLSVGDATWLLGLSVEF